MAREVISGKGGKGWKLKKIYEIFIGFARFILIRMQILRMLSTRAVLTFTK